jgi:hypothetical protein
MQRIAPSGPIARPLSPWKRCATTEEGGPLAEERSRRRGPAPGRTSVCVLSRDDVAGRVFEPER